MIPWPIVTLMFASEIQHIVLGNQIDQAASLHFIFVLVTFIRGSDESAKHGSRCIAGWFHLFTIQCHGPQWEMSVSLVELRVHVMMRSRCAMKQEFSSLTLMYIGTYLGTYLPVNGSNQQTNWGVSGTIPVDAHCIRERCNSSRESIPYPAPCPSPTSFLSSSLLILECLMPSGPAFRHQAKR